MTQPDQQPEQKPETSYRDAGVDEEREQNAFSKVMRPWLARTRVASPLVTSITGLASGYFATLLHIPPGPPIALTTDGVGTKILLARQANRWEAIGIDVVANNVNDLVCVGAVPLALLDYMATDRIDEGVFEELARGMYLGANLAGIAIPGGEIAQIGAMLARPGNDGNVGNDGNNAPMLDLVGTAMGAMPPADPREKPEPGRITEWRRPVDGADLRAGDVIIGLPSSGLHSNGYSLARHALFDIGGLTLNDQVGGKRLADALLQPTRVYVAAAEALWAANVQPKGLVHISGGGLLNLGRLAADVSYELDALPAPPPIFKIIAEAGKVPTSTMYATFNMGIGFCVVVSQAQQQAAIAALRQAGEEPVRIGWVTGRTGRSVTIPAEGLTGHGDAFRSR
jgi:phosphoribosylformylglycinamidine cyclo-ligase